MLLFYKKFFFVIFLSKIVHFYTTVNLNSKKLEKILNVSISTITSFVLLLFGGRFFGSILSLYLSVSTMALTFMLSFYYFLNIVYLGLIYEINLWSWIDISPLLVDFKFLLDPLSISFALLISFITLLVQFYSIDYMKEDPNKVKFFAYLNFFAAAMITLVTAGNYIVMFLGWEAVGLASFLLINFWSTEI